MILTENQFFAAPVNLTKIWLKKVRQILKAKKLKSFSFFGRKQLSSFTLVYSLGF